MASTSGSGNEDVIYGPLVGSVLTEQANHRCEYVLSKDDSALLLRSRRADYHTFQTAYPKVPHARVLHKLNEMGFYRVYKLSKLENDLGLITALVERWRPETNTFHLRNGEATVTLQDIAIIWGLPVDGRPVIANDECRTIQHYQARIFDILGIETQLTDFPNGGLKLKAETVALHVSANHTQITPLSDEAIVDKIARCWAFLLIGVMCPDNTGDVIPCFWLKVLEDIPAVGTYSWGSAILANLYRSLSKSCLKKANSIAGPLNLLQIWAWSRIVVIRPTQLPHVIAPVDDNGIARAPYAARWYPPRSRRFVIANNLPGSREQLDLMTDLHFVWTPYNFSDPDIAELPEQCLNWRVWTSSVPLICFNIVEWHRPERVMRQFGYVQTIPPTVERFRRIDRRGRDGRNWISEHRQEIEMWQARENFTINGDSGLGTAPEYEEWYQSITRRFISRTLNWSRNEYQTGTGPLLHNVRYEVQNAQHLLRQVPQTHSVADRILGTVRLSLSNIAGLVSCTRTNDAVRRAHTSAPSEHILPQRRSRSVAGEDIEEDAQRRWTHTQSQHVDPPSPVYRPTFEPQSQVFHSTPDPQAQGFYYSGEDTSYGMSQDFNYGGEGTSYRRSDSSDTLIPLEMLFGPTELTPPQNQRNISPVHLNWDMNSPAPPEPEYITQEDQPPPRNDQRRRSERVVNPTVCLTELQRRRQR